MHELRCKNVNYAMAIDGKAIAPLLGGLAGDGSSGLSTYLASRLVNDLRYHEDVLRNEQVCDAITQDMRARGLDVAHTLEFELVFLDDLTPTPELLAALTAETCISPTSPTHHVFRRFS